MSESRQCDELVHVYTAFGQMFTQRCISEARPGSSRCAAHAAAPVEKPRPSPRAREPLSLLNLCEGRSAEADR